MEKSNSRNQHTFKGVLAGAGVLIGTMVLIAILLIVTGWLVPGDPEVLNRWLTIQMIVGPMIAVFSGLVARRIGHDRAVLLLALFVLTLGLAEAAELVHHTNALTALWAPLLAAVAVLLGGWRPKIKHILSKTNIPGFEYGAPIGILVAASLVALLVVPRLDDEAAVVTMGLTFDFTMVFPAMVYVFLVRTGRLPPIAIIPAFVIGYAVATSLIPTDHHATLDVIRWFVLPAEFLLIAYLVILARRTFAGTTVSDFVSRLRAASMAMVKNRQAADIIATEFGLIYHAFRRSKPLPENHYTVYKKSGYTAIVMGLMFVVVVETTAVHFLVSQWSAVAAWILTGLSIYAGIWLIGDLRAFRQRPLTLSSHSLDFRFGLRWESDIHWENIRSVEFVRKDDSADLKIALIGRPNLRLRFFTPIELIGLYGIRKHVTSIAVAVDKPEDLVKDIKHYLPLEAFHG